MPNEILVVDENEDVLNLVREMFEGSGFQVFTANNIEDALNIAEKCLPDIILIDIIMPDNGFEACKRLKNQLGTSDIPVLMFTVMNNIEYRSKAEEVGADGYIIKPFDVEELIEIICRYL